MPPSPLSFSRAHSLGPLPLLVNDGRRRTRGTLKREPCSHATTMQGVLCKEPTTTARGWPGFPCVVGRPQRRRAYEPRYVTSQRKAAHQLRSCSTQNRQCSSSRLWVGGACFGLQWVKYFWETGRLGGSLGEQSITEEGIYKVSMHGNGHDHAPSESARAYGGMVTMVQGSRGSSRGERKNKWTGPARLTTNVPVVRLAGGGQGKEWFVLRTSLRTPRRSTRARRHVPGQAKSTASQSTRTQ